MLKLFKSKQSPETEKIEFKEIDIPSTNPSSALLKHNHNIALEKLGTNLDHTDFSLLNLKEATERVFDSMTEQLKCIDNVSEELTVYSSLSQEVFSNTEESKQISENTVNTAVKGSDAMNNSLTAIQEIENSVISTKHIITNLTEKSKEVYSLIDIIKAISKQTNLLSLNASIEAARAGEFGKGFSVVAGEIKKLAQTSDDSAEQIARTIKDMEDSILESAKAMDICISKVEEGTEVSKNTKIVFNNIISAIESNKKTSDQINLAITEQVQSLDNILSSIENLKTISTKVSTLVEWLELNTNYTEASLDSLELVFNNLKSSSEKLLKTLEDTKGNLTSLNIFLPGQVASIDPIKGLDQISYEVVSCLHNGLLCINSKGDILPGVAKSWSLENDGVTWIFNIRKNIKFHNMKEITAEDVKFSLERLLDPKNSSGNSYFLSEIVGAKEFQNNECTSVKGIKIINSYCISIELVSPYSSILYNLANCCCAVICKQAYLNNNQIVGCGPFIFDPTNDSKLNIQLKAFYDYYGGSPYVDKLNFKYNKDSIVESFEKGDLDILKTDNPTLYKKLIKSQNININISPVLNLWYGGFTFDSSKPWCTNSEIRNAFNYAIDRNKIINELFNGLGSPAKGPFPEGLIKSNLKTIPCDKNYSKQIIRKYNLNNKEFKIAYFSYFKSLAEFIQQDLRDIGLNAKIYEEDYHNYFDKHTLTEKYDLFLFSWTADSLNVDIYIEALFHSHSQYNLGNYSNTTVDKLLSQGKEFLNPKAKNLQYLKIQELLMDDSPWLYLFSSNLAYMYKDTLSGVSVNPLGGISYENVMFNS
ncbi:ABC transporter substrate-binding protein [Hathewaya limosa]|uniref:ABC-type transport system substrate-binding protein n=1 Tax=Hathewaya limosa TaxID=1536 RepID=A0ABU0JWN4_HATLI|nr:ABC transporter substrate-binding protein [Hathewaya limosa]MDQ0480563.1 ABC-type transport system substrate-binding protein [Hathewaya limosa]